MDGAIFLVEKNLRGAWVIYGTEGVKQYYDCTKAEAIKKYQQEYREFYAKQERSKT